uniref:DUF4150 domain-containing protein n=1 Tax=Schistosoma curassoni TaxID=6186 RepID=A0A183K3Q0_9TREM
MNSPSIISGVISITGASRNCLDLTGTNGNALPEKTVGELPTNTGLRPFETFSSLEVFS